MPLIKIRLTGPDAGSSWWVRSDLIEELFDGPPEGYVKMTDGQIISASDPADVAKQICRSELTSLMMKATSGSIPVL